MSMKPEAVLSQQILFHDSPDFAQGDCIFLSFGLLFFSYWGLLSAANPDFKKVLILTCI